MNKVILMGRLSKDVDLRRTNDSAIGKFSLAVDRKFKRDGDPSADFINCTVFGKTAETIQKYFSKGSKILITGRIQTGSYTNRDGNKVYTTDVIVDEFEFVEKRQDNASAQDTPYYN